MAEDKFTYQLKIEPVIDDKAASDLEKTLNHLATSSFEGSNALTKDMKKMLELQERAAILREDLARLSSINTKEAQDASKIVQQDLDAVIKNARDHGGDLGKTSEEQQAEEELKVSQEKWDKIQDMAVSTFKKVADKISDAIIDTFKDAWKEMQNMISYSRLSDSHTRDLAFSYGFTGSQAYGYDKAMKMMGFGSMEDLYYANDFERSKFQELMSKYAERYSQLYDSGFFETQMEYNIEMEELKQDLQLELVEFFTANKDEIKSAMKAIMSMSATLMKILGWLVDKWGGPKETSDSERASRVSDVISNYSSKSTQVKVENTLNITGDTSKNAQDTYSFIMDQISQAAKTLEE